MIQPDIDAHAQAILTRLRADSGLASLVCDADASIKGEVRVPPFVVVYPDSGYRRSERFTGGQWSATFTYVVHSVGSSPSAARAVAQAVYAQLLGFQPTIAGRSCRKIIAARSVPVSKDPDVAGYWFGVDEFDLTTSPA